VSILSIPYSSAYVGGRGASTDREQPLSLFLGADESSRERRAPLRTSVISHSRRQTNTSVMSEEKIHRLTTINMSIG